MKRFLVFGCCLAVMAATADAPKPILGRSNTLQGMVLRNRYAYIAVLRPMRNDGWVSAGVFRRILPRTRIDGRETLDPAESMFRYIIRPEMLVTVQGRRGARQVASEAGWNMTAMPAGGVMMKQENGEDGKVITAEVTCALRPDRSMLDCVCRVTSTMERECTVHFRPEFYVQIPELKPARLILPRRINQFTIAGKETYWRNEETLLNNDYAGYWWRAAGNNRMRSEEVLNSEQIHFDDAQVVAPEHFGLANLAGDDMVVWNWDDKGKPAALEFKWQRDVARVTPVWSMTFAPGESREIHFKLLMVRGAPRYDNIEKSWILAYLPDGRMLRVLSLPLKNEERLSLNVSLADRRGTQMVNSRREMAGATPMKPGSMNYPMAAPFIPGERYKLQLQMDSLKDSTRLLEVSGLVQP